MRIFVSIMIIWAFVLCAGCQPNRVEPGMPTEVAASPTAEPVSTTPGEPQMTQTFPTPADVALQNLIERIREDLAARTGVSRAEISLVEANVAEWSDSSLDCPQEGMSYLQVITPGYRILLQANNQTYEYHTNRDSHFVFCSGRLPPIIPQP